MRPTADRDLRIIATDVDVTATMLRPESRRALLVLGHGAGAGMRHRFLQGIAEALAANGIGTLRYQFPYAEAGRRRPDRSEVLVRTVRAAVGAARDAEPDLPIFAGGKSMGGRMTTLAQTQRPLPAVRGIVLFGFPLHRPGDPSDARADHLVDVELPLLFVQGTRDRLAELDRVRKVVEALGDRAVLHVIPDADHGFDVPKRAGLTPAAVYAGMAAAVRHWIDAVLG